VLGGKEKEGRRKSDLRVANKWGNYTDAFASFGAVGAIFRALKPDQQGHNQDKARPTLPLRPRLGAIQSVLLGHSADLKVT
jgi:hypothetical protein